MGDRFLAALLSASLLAACSSQSYTVGGTVSGLEGSGLVLQNLGVSDYTLKITKNGAFTLPGFFAPGAQYFVTVVTQPTSPQQTCTISSPNGAFKTSNITSVAVKCTTGTFAVGGTVTGLLGSGLVLQDNGGDNMPIAANGTFSFATPVANDSAYAVTVVTQPTMPSQTCTVTSGTGMVGTAPVTSVLVSCGTSTFTIGGSISGLVGSGLVLEDNGGDALTITSGTTFTFATPVASGGTYAVAVLTQPSNPSQTCTVSGGVGTVSAGNVTSITVNCSSDTYTIGGAVAGLIGTGLVLQDNDGDNLSLTANGLFAFATPIVSGGTYAVTILSQPTGPSQTCTLQDAMGTVVATDITTIVVSCTANVYPLSGTITGLVGSGLVLQDNGGDNVAVTPDATTFNFATPVASGAPYQVTVSTQPSNPSQTCTVTNDASGTVAGGPITDIAVTCTTNLYPVGGTVLGLTGSGLVLQDNGGDNYAVTGNGVFAFPTPIASGAMFNVTVLTQPSMPAQTCVVSGASGTAVNAPVSTVTVNCGTNDYTVSGTTTGLIGSGLVLALNGSSDLAVESNGTFSFAQTLTDGSPYSVAIISQPTGPSQTCTVSGATGTIAAASISSVAVSCSANSYPISVTVTGLVGTGLLLEDNGSDTLAVPMPGSYTFPTLVASGTAYSVTVSQQPTMPAQTCTVAEGAGTVAGAAVSNVTVTCSTSAFTVGGTITGLVGTVVLQDNASDTLVIPAPAMTPAGGVPFTFAVPVASGSPYVVSVSQQPGSPSQVCTVSSGASGTMGSAPVTSVGVTCSTNAFNVEVTVVGLLGVGLVLQDNVGDMVPVSANGTITMPTPQASGAAYTVSVLDHPTSPAQTCNVLGGTGTVGASNVTGITVNCGTNLYTLSGTVTGLAGAGLVLTDNLGDSVPISGNGTFSFPTAYSSGALYAVTVESQPQSPWQTCTAAAGTSGGIVGNSNITTVAINCVDDTYAVAVNVTGLSGTGLELADNASDTLAVTQNGLSTFAIPVASGSSYAVTVLGQPQSPWQTCSVTNGSGSIAGVGVTVSVSCTTNQYPVSVTVTGLSGSGLTLLDNGGNQLSVTGNGTFPFTTPVISGGAYAVTIAAQPTNPTQTCVAGQPGTVAGGPATVTVHCATSSFTIGGTVTGLATGETVLLANGTDSISVMANGAFTFDAPVASGASYAVTVTGQPSSPLAQTCTVGSASGTVGAANVTGVVVSCAANVYLVGGTLIGYAGSGLVLQDNSGVAPLTVAAGATSFTFPAPLVSGSTYAVSVVTQPTGPTQTCSVSDGSGTVAGAAVTSVAIVCTTSTFAVGGTVTGLVGSGLVLQNNTSSVTISATQATFQFPPVASGGTYSVSVQAQPSSPTQSCTVTNGSGTVTTAAVTNITVSCTTSSFSIGGTISNLTGSGLEIQLNGTETLSPAPGATSFTFMTTVVSGQSYSVALVGQPTSPWQSCFVSQAAGTVGGASVTGIQVSCTTNSFAVGGTVLGLAGAGLVLQNNSASTTLTLSSSGSFQFPAVPSGGPYAITVVGQPSSPAQTCVVANGSGTVADASVTNVVVTCTSTPFTVGGTISGYAGTGLQLLLNGTDAFTATDGATSFVFSSPVPSGEPYVVTIGAQPSSPTQSCTVTGGSGNVGAGNVTSVAVSCTTSSFAVGGTVTGLAGTGLVLQNNAFSNTVTVSANGAFTFPPVVSGGAYAVSVQTQPSSPQQGCTVTNGTGTVAGAAVNNITVSCSTNTFAVGGTISGYAGSGLQLELNGAGTITVAPSATTFTFGTLIPSGGTYAVSVETPPSAPSQTCTVASGTGTVGTSNVTSVTVTCATSSFPVGGTVSGLLGAGLVLQNNSASITVAVSANGTFQFPAIASGSAYAVTVQTEPSGPTQTCTVTNGSGTVGTGPVTSVLVSCASTPFTVGGTISGYTGAGLALLLNGGSAFVAPSGSTSFVFSTPVPSGDSYAVTIATQPSSPTQSCTVALGSGTVGASNVTTVAITCSTSAYAVGGTVTGLLGSGLVLMNSESAATLTISANGAFQFPSQASGSTYAVVVEDQPSSPTQTCTVGNGMGTVGSTPVTSILVTCATTPFTIGGTLSGYAGSGLQLTLNGGSTMTVAANATTFVFTPGVVSGATYAVAVADQPSSPTQTCVVTGGVGTVGSSNVNSVVVTCTTGSFTVGGTVTGLLGSGLVIQNSSAANTLAVTANGAFQFPAVLSGATYAVTVQTEPASPTQTCVVTNGTGTVGGGAVTNILITCAATPFTIGGTLSGYAGSGLQLLLNGADAFTAPASSTSFVFTTAITSGSNYTVTVGTQPSSPTQTCAVTSGSGTVGAANVTSVLVTCTTNSYAVGGTVTGLVGKGLMIQNSSSTSPLAITANGVFAFPAVLSGSGYAVTVQTSPSTPTQSCAVTNGSGTVGGAAVTNIVVTCTTSSFTIGGTLVGYSGTGLALQDNGGNTLTVAGGSTTFTFTTPVVSGGTYAVTALTQPTTPWQTCAVTSGSGTVTSANVTSVVVTCITNTYALGGTITGLLGTGLVLQNSSSSTTVSVSANGSWQFPPVASGSTYAVTVQTPPSLPTQTCTITNGTGTITNAAITNVSISCVRTPFTIGGTISGYTGTGLELQLNGTDTLTIASNAATFTFPTADAIQSGQNYAVTILLQPTKPTQACTVASGFGTVGGANVTSVVVTCATQSFAVGGSITGLEGGTVVLQNSTASNTLSISTNGTFAFPPVASNTTYAVTVQTQPTAPTQTCTVTGGTGTVGSAPVTNIVVTCVGSLFPISGKITGYTGSGLQLQDNGGDTLSLSSGATTFTFATPIASGQTYAVSLLTDPSSPTQSCVITNGMGTVTNAAITSVVVTCTTSTFTYGGTVGGLAPGDSVVLQGDTSTVTVSVDGAVFAFPAIASGGAYAVTVLTQPGNPEQSCVVQNGTGNVTNANVTNIAVTCTTGTYTVGGTVSGLVGGGMAVMLNGANYLSVPVGATAFTFPASIASGATYVVALAASPGNPSQTCSITNASGTIGMANVTNIAIVCATNTFTVTVTVEGLTAGSVVLEDNGADNLTITSNGMDTFATPIPSGGTYNVTVSSPPPFGQSCTVADGSGSVTDAKITNVVVTCIGLFSQTFTTCGATGATGPTQAQCTTAYAPPYPTGGEVTVTGGIQTWTVPITGTYVISANGGQGASGQSGLVGGLGAAIQGTFVMTQGTVLKILVGQQGAGQNSGNNGGGGGGSFVVTGTTPLVVAGGGGGLRISSTVNGFPGLTTTAGGNGVVAPSGSGGQTCAGGTGGSGGSACSSYGAAGGGFSGNGASDEGTGGLSFVTGGTGGSGGSCGSANGGFGGGGSGSGCDGGGGGGGYSGGGGGSIAGGGGSFNSGTGQLNTQGGAPTGNGSVIIALINNN